MAHLSVTTPTPRRGRRDVLMALPISSLDDMDFWKSSGRKFVGESMRSTAVATWVVLTLLASTASAFAEEPLALYDANGLQMGRLEYDAVQLTVNGQKYFVPVSPASHSTVAMDFAPYTIHFESTNCTGQKLALFQHSYGAPFAVAQVEPSGRVLLRPAATRWKRTSLGSYLRQDGKCCQQYFSVTQAVPLLDPVDITDLFARPFAVN